MTDVELPTPFHYANAGKGEALFTAEQVRACVAHATAAKDAELVELRSTIEALQRQVEILGSLLKENN